MYLNIVNAEKEFSLTLFFPFCRFFGMSRVDDILKKTPWIDRHPAALWSPAGRLISSTAGNQPLPMGAIVKHSY